MPRCSFAVHRAAVTGPGLRCNRRAGEECQARRKHSASGRRTPRRVGAKTPRRREAARVGANENTPGRLKTRLPETLRLLLTNIIITTAASH
jgi:hypothetical protein